MSLDVIRQVPVIDGQIDRNTVAQLVPAAVVDPGGNGWPTIVKDERLLPTIWQALRDVADALDLLAAAVVNLNARVEALETPPQG